jgi:hypothetical protein
LTLIITLIAIVLFLVYPVKFSAEKLGADDTGFIRCLLAVIASVSISAYAGNIVSSSFLHFVISMATTAIVFSVLLGAKFIQSILISLMSTVIQAGLLFALISLGFLSQSVAN